MNSAPITTWEGAEAYFTFADKPAVLMLIAVLGILAGGYTLVSMIKHENACYNYTKKKP
ncbi:hypothetical protein NOF55_13375 [Rhizobiaceae bacterium BDR2-2]|uniref:Uncharacterized protein n=1 Tax=Ectorhizobium quercum TaxID=2965071 RepID=A0AAE3N0V9_9HYPH|nr:hypothetical protein [Ectorhizobium quercum]MCX8998096.1 hypothetical protein [Ectorhizobium quercum]